MTLSDSQFFCFSSVEMCCFGSLWQDAPQLTSGLVDELSGLMKVMRPTATVGKLATVCQHNLPGTNEQTSLAVLLLGLECLNLALLVLTIDGSEQKLLSDFVQVRNTIGGLEDFGPQPQTGP